MTNRLLKLFISDIRYTIRIPLLLSALLSPVIIALSLLYLYPVVSGFTRSGDMSSNGSYYSVIAVTLISSIPLIYGQLFSFIHLRESGSQSYNRAGKVIMEAKSHLRIRMVISASLCFIFVLPVVYLTDPVSTEGWLRSIYATFLLSVMTLFIFLFAICFTADIKKRKILLLVFALFLITVPSGLLLHHPWNYFIFFSPFYWFSWAWVIASPAESVLYGTISMALTATGMLIICRYLARKKDPVSL
jgi:hypothetical protein